MTSGRDLSKEEYQWQLRNGWMPGRDYVFVSYSSRDWEKVYPCVMAMRARGINVYIDIEFMENQSSSWLKNFQERLFRDSGCKGIVAFLSINYMRSYACLVEQMANRTNKMRKRMGKPLPVFYVALDPELATLQQMAAYIYTDKIRRESVSEQVDISPPEYAVLQKFILDSRIDGYRREEAVQELLDDIHDKHDVVTTMHELIFRNAPDMPSIQMFEGVEKCAQLLTDNFINSKNDSIKLTVLEELKRAARERLGEAGQEEPVSQEEEPEQIQGAAVQRGEHEVAADISSEQRQMLEQLIEAAEQGDASAQSRLGLLYRQGNIVEQSYLQAEKWFRRAAEQNDVYGQFRLGLLYRQGKGVIRSNTEALKWFQKAAEQGHVDAQFRLGLMYRKGKGTMPSPEKAAYWFRKAAEQGHANALRALRQLEEQEGKELDAEPPVRQEQPSMPLKEESSRPEQQGETDVHLQQQKKILLDQLRKAAESGSGNAQYQLGRRYKYGTDVEQSYELAKKWLQKALENGVFSARAELATLENTVQPVRKEDDRTIAQLTAAAEQGDLDAQSRLALRYKQGLGVERSYERAAKWYQAGAEQGLVTAQYNLALLYKDGLGVERSYELAEEWFRLAAEQGHIAASYYIGLLYCGENGKKPDYERAAKWFRRAAEQGHANAQCKLGVLYKYGVGVERSTEQAREWLRLAVEQGHTAAFKELSTLNDTSKLDENVKWLHIAPEREETAAQPRQAPEKPAVLTTGQIIAAAEWGDADAQFKLASKYQHGQGGIPQSLAKAVAWYCKAAEQGHAGAQYNLGLLYRNGKGVEQSFEQAAKWLRRAAEQGYAGAQYELGVLYQKGRGVEQSEQQMLYWYRQAAEQGHVNAKKQLAALRKKGQGLKKDQ